MASQTRSTGDAAVCGSDRRSSVVLGGLAFLVCAAAVGCSNKQDDAGDKTASGDPPSAAVAASEPGARASEAAAAFIALAGGDSAAEVPWAERVAYYVGGSEIGLLPSGPGLPAALSACPEGVKEYEGRACPVSPLRTVEDLVQNGDRPVIEPGTPEVVGCTKVAELSGIDGLTDVSIRPPTDARDCFSDFSVTLYSNAAGFVERIDFTLSGP